MQSEICKIFLKLLCCYLGHQISDSWKGIVFTVENNSTLSEDEVSVKCFSFVCILVISNTRSAPTITVEGLAQH